ncbi:MAG: hypothetical protein ACLUAO_04820 [Streptococcus sp.]
MLILKEVLKPDSLEPFGFTATEQGYEFRKTLIAEELEARLFIDLEGKLTGQVVDMILMSLMISSGVLRLLELTLVKSESLWRTSVTGS